MDATLLAIDTATDQLALALIWQGGQLTHQEAGGALASARLIPAIRDLLGRAQLPMRRVSGIAFGAGPGAFTGLRTACAVAQGLAFGLGLQVVALDSLMLVAEDAHPEPDQTGVVWVAMDARMDEIYAAAYERRPEGGWAVHTVPALYGWQTLAARWTTAPPSRVVGSALQAFAGRLPVAAAHCTVYDHDRAAALARLTRQAWTGSNGIDPANALPIYLRDKVAQTSAERALAKATQ